LTATRLPSAAAGWQAGRRHAGSLPRKSFAAVSRLGMTLACRGHARPRVPRDRRRARGAGI